MSSTGGRAARRRPSERRTVDWLVVGSGAGGLSSGIFASDLGLDVLVVEKASLLGGVTAYSYGQVWVPGNHLAFRPPSRSGADGGESADATMAEDVDAAKAYVAFLGAGFGDPGLRDVLIEEAGPVVRTLEQRAGVPWQVISGLPDYHWPEVEGAVADGRYLEVGPIADSTLGAHAARVRTSPYVPIPVLNGEMHAWGGLAASASWNDALAAERRTGGVHTLGPGMARALVRALCVDRGVEAWVDAPVVALRADDEGVTGAVVRRANGEVEIEARCGVLLATGGYDWNSDLTRAFDQLPDWKSLCPPSITGDHLSLAGALGAAVAAVPPHNLSSLFGVHVPGEQQDGVPLWRSAGFEAGLPHAILVNDRGCRFADESFYKDLLPRARRWDGRRQRYENLPMYLVVDDRHRSRYALAGFPPGAPLPPALAATSPTVDGLAAELGIDAAALRDTIDRFNAQVRNGADEDFGRGRVPWARIMAGDLRHPGNANLGTVERPPFTGMRLWPVSGGINAAGLRADASARVLHVEGHPIPGLYAAGNAVAHLDVGAGYQSGIANLRGLVWGAVAARHAATRRDRTGGPRRDRGRGRSGTRRPARSLNRDAHVG
ncbi:MAG: FAD-binding protein [Myxococcota bacterium]